MPVAFLVRRLAWNRVAATAVSGAVIFCIGLTTVASFSVWREWRPLAAVRGLSDATVFDLIDSLSSNLLLPAAGLGISLFAGWILPADIFARELGIGSGIARLLRGLLRYVIPVLIVLAAIEPLLRPR